MQSAKVVPLLIVDDDDSFRDVASSLLSVSKDPIFDVTWMKDGETTLRLLKGGAAFSLLLIDYSLPDMNGLQLVEELRRSQINTPVIFLTSAKDFRLVVEAIKWRVEDYLVKKEVINSTFARTIIDALARVEHKRDLEEQFTRDIILRRRIEAVKELIVTVCHEFNNPLAAMKISTDILTRQKLPPEEQELVAELDNTIRRIEAEITQLRDMNPERSDMSAFGQRDT